MRPIKVICFPFNSIPSLSHCINATPRDMAMQAQSGGKELKPVRNFALEERGWSVPRCGRFTLGKGPSPILREAGCASGLSGQERETSSSLGFDLRTVQPVASRYID